MLCFILEDASHVRICVRIFFLMSICFDFEYILELSLGFCEGINCFLVMSSFPLLSVIEDIADNIMVIIIIFLDVVFLFCFNFVFP